MNSFMFVVRALFTFTWLLPLLMVGWIIGLITLPIYHGYLMIKDSLEEPETTKKK